MDIESSGGSRAKETTDGNCASPDLHEVVEIVAAWSETDREMLRRREAHAGAPRLLVLDLFNDLFAEDHRAAELDELAAKVRSAVMQLDALDRVGTTGTGNRESWKEEILTGLQEALAGGIASLRNG